MLRHSIDHVALRDGYLFSFGWGFACGALVNQVTLVLQLADQSMIEIDVDYGGKREDVHQAFPDIKEAANSGFLVLAGWPNDSINSALLRWQIEGSTTIETVLPLPSPCSEILSASPPLTTYSRMALLRKGLVTARNQGLSALLKKIRKHFGAPTKACNGDLTKLTSQLSDKKITLVVDHDMGGGANVFRAHYVEERKQQGQVVILLSFHVATLQFFIEMHDRSKATRLTLPDLTYLWPVIRKAHIQEVLYNCAVSFHRPIEITRTILALKRQRGSRLTLAVHDYLMVCPSHFLLNSAGRFCGIPHEKDCNKCLEEHRDGFVSVAKGQSIAAWRNSWGELLAAADDVRLFSDSSRRILSRAYPTLAQNTWRVIPHKLPEAYREIAVPKGRSLHIGIIGAIGKHKGAKIVCDLGEEIRRRNSDARITIIGTLQGQYDARIITVTGPYDPKELEKLVAKSGANIFFMPSICSETFSYVSHEIVSMGLPFACLDIGAPADIARQYHRGKIFSDWSAPALLDELESFWHKTYLSIPEESQ